MKCTFNIDLEGKKVICVSHYAGKAVRGIARCYSTDTFNSEDGKKLARLRCEAKVAKKRVATSQKRVEDARVAVKEALAILDRCTKQLDNAIQSEANIATELTAFENKLFNT